MHEWIDKHLKEENNKIRKKGRLSKRVKKIRIEKDKPRKKERRMQQLHRNIGLVTEGKTQNGQRRQQKKSMSIPSY